MGGLLLLSGIVVTVVILAVLARDFYLRIHDPMSYKHLFLVGFIVFFGTGTIFTVISDVGSDLHVASDRAKGIMAASLVAFLAVFLLSLRVGLSTRLLDKVVPKLELPRTTPGVLIPAIGALGLVVASLAFPAKGESLLAALASYFRGGMSVVATGLATYWLLAQRFNPISWMLFIGTLGVAMVASIYGEQGRRQLLGVMMVVPWVWYYTTLRYQSPAKWLPKAGIVVAGAFVMIVGYSNVRPEMRDQDRSLTAVANALVQSARTAEVSNKNLREDLFYQDAATNSMYIIDGYGQTYRQQPLRGLIYVLVNPIPRSVWPGKPDSLGNEISLQIGTLGNLGPGIIGHGWAEAGFIGVIYYAIFFGFIIGVADRQLQLRADNPFFVTAMGSILGQSIAMSRGDTPNFFIQSILTILIAGGMMYACKLVFGTIMAAFPRLETGARLVAGATGEDDPEAEPIDDGGGAEFEPSWGEQDWGQASAAWDYSEHEAEQR